jgi:hypothetical protein
MTPFWIGFWSGVGSAVLTYVVVVGLLIYWVCGAMRRHG